MPCSIAIAFFALTLKEPYVNSVYETSVYPFFSYRLGWSFTIDKFDHT